MPEFDPDKYLSKLDRIKKQEQPTPPTPSDKPRSPLQSAMIGMSQGATFGLGDEAIARLESIRSGRPYEDVLQEARGMYKSASEQNPASYLTGEIGAGIAAPIGQAATGAKLGRLAAMGAGTGALSGLGYSEGKTAGEVARDVAIGGTLGGGLSVLGSKLFPKKLQSEISKKAGETVSKEASAKTGQTVTQETIKQEAKKSNVPLQELERSLQGAKSAVEENLGSNLSRADELISTLTGKKESLINFLRQNPEKSKQIAEITNTAQSSDELARILTEYATKNPTRRQGIEAATRGKTILQNSNINITNQNIFDILDQSRKRIIEKNKLGISTPLNLAQKEIEDISEKVINQESYDGTALRNLLSNLDDQVNKYGGYYDINQKNKAIQNELKKVRGEINNYIKNQLPEDVRGEYEKQYKIASTKLNQAENIESMLTSKKASMRKNASNTGDLEKANTILSRYISRPTAGKEAEVSYLTKLLKEETPSLNLKDELDKIRIAKQIESEGNKGSDIVNAFRGMAKVNLPVEFPGSKLITSPIEKMMEGEAAYIGKRLGTKGGKIAQEWADYSGQLIKEGKTPTQSDAFKFILSQSSKEMEPGFKQSLLKKFGANLPEEAIPMNLPSPSSSPIPPMGSPIPTPSPIPGQKSTRESLMNKFTIPQSEQRGFQAQQGLQRGLLDQFLTENAGEVRRKREVENNFNNIKNRATK
jgi:hypothetical protein